MRFNEVFPKLHLDPEVAMYFENAEISHIKKSTTGLNIRIYLESNKIIPKKYIIELEKALFTQIFEKFGANNLRVLDRYNLINSYSPENIYNEYKESIRLELETYFSLAFITYKDTDVIFDGDRLELRLPRGFAADNYGEELRNYFSDLFLKRFRTPVDVYITHKDRTLGKYEEIKNKALEREVNKIISETNIFEEKPKEEKENAPVKEKAPAKKEEKKSYNVSYKNEDVLYGRDFPDEEIVPIRTIDETTRTVAISGMIRRIEKKPIKNDRTILMFDITDFTDTITADLFVTNEKLAEFDEIIKKGAFIKLKGDASFNQFEQDIIIGRVYGIRSGTDTREVRLDTAEVKRVELHCHTKMSDMDGVSSASDIINKAHEFGHPAIAITDHGVVQAFPECLHASEKMEDFKVIYGVEAYLIDDDKPLVRNGKGQSLNDEFVVFDIETTGFSAHYDRIIEIGAVKIKDGKITERFSEFVNPQIPIPIKIEKLTSINDGMVANADTIDKVLPRFLNFIGDAAVVAHNAEFDVSFIADNAERLGHKIDFTVLDTVLIAQYLMPGLKNFKLDTLVKHLGVVLNNHHRAVDDAEATSHIFLKLIDMLNERDIFTLDDLLKKGKIGPEALRKLHPYHAVLLATSIEGKNNLYRMISASHLEHFYRFPKIPKSLLKSHREGILVGSACASGELFSAILNGRNEQVIANIVDFYDYLEIMPVGNSEYLIEDENSFVKSEDDIRDINRKIVDLGIEFNKPVCATGDVHFLNPEDSIYRAVIQAGSGFKDFDRQPPLYLKTTDEMLKEFEYLGSEKAYEVVVKNTNMIADMCEKISPIRPDKCPPVIENSDETLRQICINKAHEMYGPVLPEEVSSRLDRELNSIISNGYSVMYIIAQQLVWKSNDDGYLVGSRGSVGSSFAATMAGITEVNPLSPHYLCDKCYYVDFKSEDVLKFAGGAGCDMPDKVCPKCGNKLQKLGFDIPFETFLGFKGNKEPDIDLNFSNEYQGKAHAFTEVIFGKGQTFKAGTIGTVAEKTAFGLVKGYFEELSEKTGTTMVKRKCEIERIASGCVDVRRTTGQHPGGIVVLPIGEEIHTFTPVQHPANDMKSDIVTTHFDYHSIDHNLLKLDILGHLDPTMIKYLQDMTGVDPLTIPLDSKEVMSLFANTEALGIKPEQIGGTELGTLGVPEFGTDFAMGMLKEAKPTQFSDLVRIAGLAHGTDVWLGNAQKLIQEGTATISTAVCTRDDIMVYLINKGMDSELSFNIMEKVRKGKGLTPEWEKEMRTHDVPEWYIWSCNKIKYMFPKAHAAAYVMMAWRVAYFKIFYPLEYYCAYFSIRANAFDYEKMALGKDKLKYYIADYKKRLETKELSNAEQDELKDMRLVEEMYERGLEFTPIDIYKAKARTFQIFDGKIMPSFKVIDKVGEVAGESIEIAASNGKFLSKEDLRIRAKVGNTVIEKLDSIHALDGLADSNQLSLFDL